MGTMVKTVLGRPKGTVGDVSFRLKNGKDYVVSLPGSFTPGQDDDSVERRAKFGFLVRLSSGINAIDPLQKLWFASSANGNSAFNQIVSDNYSFVTPTSVTAQTSLAPGLGFRTTTTSLNIANTGINAVFEPIGTNKKIDLTVEKSILMASIISLSDGTNDKFPGFYIIPLVSDSQTLVLDTALTFAIPFDDQESQLYDMYKTRKTLLVLITLDSDNNPVHSSITLLG